MWTSAGRPNNDSLFLNMKTSRSQYKYAIRRLQRSSEQLQNNAFVSSLLGGTSSIYQEVKKFRGQTRIVSSRIDEVVGSSNIADHFANKYSKLYNNCELGDDFQDLHREISENIGDKEIEEVNKIDAKLVGEAMKKMKGGRVM